MQYEVKEMTKKRRRVRWVEVVVALHTLALGRVDRARERLYVGMSRATDVLVVVGDPDTVRRVGGEQVARRLGV